MADMLPDNASVLQVSCAGKKFCRHYGRLFRYGITDALRFFLKQPPVPFLRKEEFWALDAISFSVDKGEAVAIVGSNGSGKSTLLRLCAGLFEPDVGSVVSHGSVGLILAALAGLHPKLTVSENAMLAMALNGIGASVAKTHIPGILTFAGLSSLAHAPTGTLSPGMALRLGFAASTAVTPDLLLIDEVLAVGDAQFKDMCIERLKNIKSRAAIVFVSHNFDLVKKLADRIIVLEKGRVVFDGNDVEKGIAMAGNRAS
jgi:lipopolysaccharide transport system ATP-binding protein